MEYTAVGDTVNVAAHLEKENKRFSTSIIVSEATWKAIKDEFDFKALGEIAIQGRSEKISVYTMGSFRKPEKS
jgi:adenylate cyclase